MYEINYCGYLRKNSDYDAIFRPNGSGDYLFLLFLTPMRITLANVTQVCRPGACLFFEKGIEQNYSAIKEFCNSFVHFSGSPASLDHYSFPRNQLFYPADTSTFQGILKNISTEYLLKLPLYEEKLDSLLHQLLVELSRSFLQSHESAYQNLDLYNQFMTLRLQMLSHCEEDWSPDRLCQMVNLEKSQFYSYYRSFFYASPKYELLTARIDKAKNLLTNETMQVKQVAALCGFHNIYHFTRYFKQLCGVSPSEYGKQNTTVDIL